MVGDFAMSGKSGAQPPIGATGPEPTGGRDAAVISGRMPQTSGRRRRRTW